MMRPFRSVRRGFELIREALTEPPDCGTDPDCIDDLDALIDALNRIDPLDDAAKQRIRDRVMLAVRDRATEQAVLDECERIALVSGVGRRTR